MADVLHSIVIEVRKEMLLQAEAELHRIGQDMVRGAVEELGRRRINYEGDLAKSIRYDLKRVPEGWQLLLVANAKHAAVVHDGAGPAAGRKKFMPPLDPILRWVRKKLGASGKMSQIRFTSKRGLLRRGATTESKKDTVETIARAVRWKIYQTGIKGRPFMLDVLRAYEPLVAKRIAGAMT